MDNEPPSIYQRILAVQKGVGVIERNAQHKQAGFWYATEDGFLNAIRPLLFEHGVLIVRTVKNTLVEPWKMESIDKQGVITSKTWMLAKVVVEWKLFNVDKPSDIVVVENCGVALDVSDHAVGQAETNANKNFYQKFFQVPVIDPGGKGTGSRGTRTASSPGDQPSGRSDLATLPQRQKISTMVHELGDSIDFNDVLTRMGAKKVDLDAAKGNKVALQEIWKKQISSMTKGQAGALIAHLEKLKGGKS